MAKPPIEAADDDTAPVEAVASDDAGADADAMADTEGDDDSGTVLLTVCKEADGTYTLIMGDEDDAASADTAESDGGAEMAPGEDAGSSKSYDSKGALLKAILDALNADDPEGSEDEGGQDDFEAGFGAAGDAARAPGGVMAPPSSTGGAAMPQKY